MNTTTELIIYLIIASAVTALIVWLLAKNKFQKQIGNLILEKTRLEEQSKAQLQSIDDAKNAMLNSFKSAATDALASNNQTFIDLAKQNLDVKLEKSDGELKQKKQEIDDMLKPLKESIDNHKKKVDEIENKTRQTFGEVSTLLAGLKLGHDQLSKETGALVTALKNPKVRGKYGEIGLKRLVEFSGMSAYCDFNEQVSTSTEEGRLRPDLIVHLPAGHDVIVDSKLPLNAYLAALETEDETERNKLMADHAKALRNHVNELSKKSYWSQFKDAPDFVVLYVDVESALISALQDDRPLMQDAMGNRIIIAGPTILITILKSIAMSWKQHDVTQNAQAISDAASELYERLRTFAESFKTVGSGLTTAISNYNKAVGSWDGRVVPGLKKLESLNATKGIETPELIAIDTTAREMKLLEE